MSTLTRTRTDPAQRAAMAAARKIKSYLWTICDDRGRYLGIGTLSKNTESLAICLLPAIRRALRRPRKGAKR